MQMVQRRWKCHQHIVAEVQRLQVSHCSKPLWQFRQVIVRQRKVVQALKGVNPRRYVLQLIPAYVKTLHVL